MVGSSLGETFREDKALKSSSSETALTGSTLDFCAKDLELLEFLEGQCQCPMTRLQILPGTSEL